MSSVKPLPDGYPRVSPYLFVGGAAAAIDFYTTVLGAEQRGDRMTGPDGRIGHAELQIGDSVIMLADENVEMGARSPKTIGGTPVLLNVYVPDVDAVFEAALAHGATVLRPLANQFYGDRSGSFADPFGHHWSVATHIEDVSPQDMMERAKAAMGGGS
ncbi:PhnB protein [Kitasatospora sp. MAA4]|uniref:VOC family protein n=1 Tax=Kitasatospora sp. MAA4 TaxID=3035093 RepID=UPI00247564C5|nr:VOC family protein [Kitasatospora sp. MAA4]MDH6131254.1 PhnB protein [Kitasatospora sp. MAA4]